MLPSAVVQLLPTPTTEPMTGNGHARNLGKEVQLLPTPNVEPLGCGCEEWGQYAPAVHRHELALGRVAPSPVEVGPSGKPRLSARAVE